MKRVFSASLGLFFLATLFIGCDGCEQAEEEVLPPWRFTSETAPYEVIFPPEWDFEPSQNINSQADITVRRDDTYFFMVIVQELPSFPSPDVFELQRIGLERLNETVDDFVIRREGPLELDGTSGMTVFAHGLLDNEPVNYIASYAIHDGFGYQIIGFTDGDNSSTLFEEVDSILSNWSFSPDEASSYDGTQGSGSLPSLESQSDLEEINRTTP